MIDTDKYEDLRLLIVEFNSGPMGSADEFAWRRHLETYDGLLAKVKRLEKESHQRWLRIQELNGTLNKFREELE